MCILCDYVLNNIPFVITDYIKTSAKDIKDALISLADYNNRNLKIN